MPSPNDLVTLAVAKDYIGGAAAGNDTKLQMLITGISRAILASINRSSVLPTVYTEIRDGQPRGLLLRNWPVQSVASVVVREPGFGGGPGVALAPYGPAAAGYVYEIVLADDPPPGSPQFLTAPSGGLWKGFDNVTITYTAGYQVTGEVATVPAGGGTVAVLAPHGAWGSDVGVAYALGGAGELVQGAPGARKYSVASGVYTFSAADAGLGVLISYGYIPEDLANACLEWIADRLAYQGRIGVASKSLGGQETMSYRNTDMPLFVKLMLASYTNVVPIT